MFSPSVCQALEEGAGQDGLLPLGAHGDEHHRAGGYLLYLLYVGSGPGGQVLKAPNIPEGGLPAGKLLIGGLAALQKGQAGGEMLQGLVTHFIGTTELESGELIQDIQAGDSEASKAVEGGGGGGG